MKKILTGVITLMAGAFFLLPTGSAEAHYGYGKRWGKKYKRCGKKRWGKKRCGKRMLMRARTWKLKKIGLSDTQIAKLKSIRTNFKKAKIPLKAQIKLLRVDLKDIMDNPTIDQSQVIALVQKIHALKGKLKILRITTRLNIRGLLSLEQKKSLRKLCKRKRMRRFRRMARLYRMYHGKMRGHRTMYRYRRWKKWKKWKRKKMRP